MKGNFIKPSIEPPAFRYQRIAASWENFEISGTNRIKKLEELNDRRCLLLGLIEKDLWQWKDIDKAAGLPSDQS